jgi:hypothetical protein
MEQLLVFKFLSKEQNTGEEATKRTTFVMGNLFSSSASCGHVGKCYNTKSFRMFVLF